MNGVVRRPLVRIRGKLLRCPFVSFVRHTRNRIIINSHISNDLLLSAATTNEVSARRNHDVVRNSHIRNDTAVAILNKRTRDTDAKATLACVLPWGHGFGWSTLPNGVWSGGMFLHFQIFIINDEWLWMSHLKSATVPTPLTNSLCLKCIRSKLETSSTHVSLVIIVFCAQDWLGHNVKTHSHCSHCPLRTALI